METLMKKKKTAKQIAAIVCIVLLAALYLITLLSAIFAFPGWQRLFFRLSDLHGCSPDPALDFHLALRAV